jgi:hypothetical protein
MSFWRLERLTRRKGGAKTIWAAISVGMTAIQIPKQDQCVADEVSAVGARRKTHRQRKTENRPVQLLCDRRGIYGIGVSDAYDIEALAWACGIDETDNPKPPDLILRPDMLRCARRSFNKSAVLQKIMGGFRHGMFTHSHEESLRQVIHHEALLRAGLPWPPPDSIGMRYWSRDKKQQDRNRQIYHGLRRGSLHIINKLIGTALQEAADPDALKLARRFAFHFREPIYRCWRQEPPRLAAG